MINKKIIAIIMMIAGIIIVGVGLMISFKEKVQYNEELNTEQMTTLLKSAHVLTDSPTLAINSITDESMLDFALAYMGAAGTYNVYYNDDGTIAITNIDEINQVVKYIFNRDINYSNVTYTIEDGKIELPIKTFGGDARIYKFKNKEYDKETDTYIAYVDQLEIIYSDSLEIINSNVTEYNPEDVIGTLVFKYKELEGRKVLLAYTFQINSQLYN